MGDLTASTAAAVGRCPVEMRDGGAGRPRGRPEAIDPTAGQRGGVRGREREREKRLVIEVRLFWGGGRRWPSHAAAACRAATGGRAQRGERMRRCLSPVCFDGAGSTGSMRLKRCVWIAVRWCALPRGGWGRVLEGLYMGWAWGGGLQLHALLFGVALLPGRLCLRERGQEKEGGGEGRGFSGTRQAACIAWFHCKRANPPAGRPSSSFLLPSTPLPPVRTPSRASSRGRGGR